MSAAGPTVLVLAPMPAFPTSAGNRRRLLATCEALQRGGFAIDLAYWAHEDQIYRRFGHHPPTDLAAMEAAFRRVFLIEPRTTIPLKTAAKAFGIDDWCPDEVGDFVAWYVSRFPETVAVLVNYVFLSRALERVPPGILKLIDTHDRFGGRRSQYRPFLAEPNFFHTDTAGEAAGLNRADVVLAIQSAEARYFEGLIPFPEDRIDRRASPRPLGEGDRAQRGGVGSAGAGFEDDGAAPSVRSAATSPRGGGETRRVPIRSNGNGMTLAQIRLLPPQFPVRRPFSAPRSIRRIGFIGHGNDPNLFSIRRFAHAWAEGWVAGRPELAVAGEICTALGALDLPGVRLLGYVDRIEDFYDAVDIVVAPMLMGSGLKMKVGEALSFGLPVIGTAIGFEGFDPVDPAHRCRDAEEVKSRVLALADDPAGLAVLTAACDALFAGYRTATEEGERALIGLLRERGGGSSAAPAQEPPARDEAAASETGGEAALACECSVRSLTASDRDLGVLVATERRPGGDAGYDPRRRRWFARADGTAFQGVGAVAVSLSPEWVRDRALPPETRAALAVTFAEVEADWEALGQVVGVSGGRVEIVLDLPSHLAVGRHPSAAFLIAPDGNAAAELRLEQVTPLLHSRERWEGRPATARDGLTLVPVSASFSGHDGASPPAGYGLYTSDSKPPGSSHPPPHPEVPTRSGGLEGSSSSRRDPWRTLRGPLARAPQGEVVGGTAHRIRTARTPVGRLLLLTDDLVGRITLAPGGTA